MSEAGSVRADWLAGALVVLASAATVWLIGPPLLNSLVGLVIFFLAAFLARRLPLLAGGVVWVGSLVQLQWVGPNLGQLVAGVWVLYCAARYGRPWTSGLAALSVPVGTVVSLQVLVAGYGAGILGRIFRFYEALWWQVLVVVLAALPLALPWFIGLAARLRDAAGAQRERAQLAEVRQYEAEQARVLAEEQEQRQLRKASAEAANARLARDVHDVVGHSLAVILAQAQASRYQQDPEQLHAAMGNIATSARRSLHEIRDLLGRAREGDVDAEAPAGGLAALIESVRASGAPVVAGTEGSPRPLPPELETVAYRVLQEMLTNALRHGDLTHDVVVTLTWADRLRIRVRNTAREETTERLPGTTGTGVPGMQNRVAAIGGHFELDRLATSGGEIVVATAWLPLRNEGNPR